MKHGRTRLVVGVTLAWTLAAVVVGAQNSLASTLTGSEPVPLGRAIQFAFLQFLPWIPVTLAVVALATRFPLNREQWLKRIGIHIIAAVLLAFSANVIVVMEYWMVQGTFRGFALLLQQGSIWATLRMHVVLLIYAAILGITQSVQYYRRTRDRELHLAKLEAQLARARLEALNAQIRPHFLFNTLHTIGQLWRSGQSDDADAVLDHLGSLFHKVQGSTSRLEVPLSEELELVREFLAIEEMRFRDRLQTSVNASPAALDCLVPPLLLQPLVENAVRHGISAVSSSGRVDVAATVDGDRLFISVRDDGPGMNAATPAPGSGTGLRNTRERLEQLYGPSAQLRISTPPGGGTRVQVEIPLNGRTPARTDALRA